MPAKKRYGKVEIYEKKLKNVMGKLGVEKFDFDYGRKSAYVDFWYKGKYNRFDHTIERAAEAGEKIQFGSDLFTQIVLSLEDLERMTRRGVYQFATWVDSLPQLNAPGGFNSVPQCFKMLGFDRIPDDIDSVDIMYKQLAKTAHPDTGGSISAFQDLQEYYQHCKSYFEGGDAS